MTVGVGDVAHASGTRRASKRVRELETRAHILRRLSWGPFPGAPEGSIEAHKTASDAIEALIAAGPKPFDPPADIDVPFKVNGERVLPEDVLGNGEFVKWWIRRMASDDAGLHEKTMWFWHTDITTSGNMGTFLYLWRQLRKIHTHALGNLRDLAKELVVDPAMMQFLNSDTSSLAHPNENLARELMELFLLGRGNYTEDDVRAGALGLAGYRIDFTKNTSYFDEKDPRPTVTFLGKTGVFDPDAIVDQILTKDAVAPFIVRKMWKFFIGGAIDDALVTKWANAFRKSDYEIRPLVESIVRSDAFLAARHSRPRHGLEWLAPVLRVLDPDPTKNDNSLDMTGLDQLGQVPYFPPNVAGWPDDSVWLSSSTGFSRASYVMALPYRVPTFPRGRRVEMALERVGLYDISVESMAALQQFDRVVKGSSNFRSAAVAKAVLMTPEYALA